MDCKAVLFIWPDRTYSAALADYYVAQDFVLEHALFMRHDVGGYIKAPRHPKHPEGGERNTRDYGTVPDHLLDDPHWHVAVIAFTDDRETLRFLEGLALPEGVTRTVTDAKP